ncbi:MAG TPA: class F sortase [Micromonosporaceae bacterium]
MIARDWSVHRHRTPPRALGATRAVATGLAVVAVLSAAAGTADMFGVHTITDRVTALESWRSPTSVQVAPPAPATPPKDAPTNLRIPAISVDTTLQSLTLNSDGALSPPEYTDAGWYAGGTVPGDAGPAVIAGHYDSATPGAPSIFYKLGKLKAGDTVQVKRGGKWITFDVTAVESYAANAFPTAAVYGPTPTAELRLITCGGVYSPTTDSYSDNVVVFAVAEVTK